MRPKEKAMELLDKYYFAKDEDGSYSMSLYKAKQCVLICVDEIIYSSLMEQPQHTMIYNPHKNDYWNKVKEEVIKL